MFGKLFKKRTPGEITSNDDSYGKLWIEALEARFGKVTTIKKMQCPNKPVIYILYFDGLPEKGCLTAITCGLSRAKHPDWKLGAPELIVTMESPSYSWGMAAGYFASSFFGEKRFSYGDVFKVDDPLSPDEGDMNAYLLFAPSFLDEEQSRFVLPEGTVNLVGLYPLYEDEIAVYDRIGLEAFWQADGFEMHNPKRSHVSSNKLS